MQRVTPTITLTAVGDVGVRRADAATMFQQVRSTVRASDLAFCQLEPVLTCRGEPLPQARLAMRTTPDSALAIRDAGFDVVSCAGNHCMDYGATGLRDTIDALQSAGLSAVGAGDDIRVARQFVIKERQGVRVAFLAYCTILPMNYGADDRRSGCAPLRAWTHFEQIESDQPGTPPRAHSFAHREDLKSMCADIASARREADHVVVSLHWGVHFVPGELAAYQRAMAYAAIDVGAALIVGHHPHVLKAVEVHRGVPIFYSLGNFALEAPTAFADNLPDSKGFREIQALASGWDAKNLLPPDTRLSLLLQCRFSKSRIEECGLLPVYLNDRCEPTIPTIDSSEFEKVVRYLDWTCTSQGLPVPYSRKGDRLQVRLN